MKVQRNRENKDLQHSIEGLFRIVNGKSKTEVTIFKDEKEATAAYSLLRHVIVGITGPVGCLRVGRESDKNKVANRVRVTKEY